MSVLGTMGSKCVYSAQFLSILATTYLVHFDIVLPRIDAIHA